MERYVTAFNQFYYLVLFAFVLQLQVLCVVVKGSVGVVVKVHVHLITNLSVYAKVYLLVEVHRRCLSVTYWQRRVVYSLYCSTKFQLCGTLCLYAHTTRTENLLGRSQVEVHIGEV